MRLLSRNSASNRKWFWYNLSELQRNWNRGSSSAWLYMYGYISIVFMWNAYIIWIVLIVFVFILLDIILPILLMTLELGRRLRIWFYLSILLPGAACQCFNMMAKLHLLSDRRNNIWYLWLDILWITLISFNVLISVLQSLIGIYFEICAVSVISWTNCFFLPTKLIFYLRYRQRKYSSYVF